MVTSIPVDEVHLVSTYVESNFYGAFVVLYMACIWVLVKRHDPVLGTNKLMVVTATALMITGTLFHASTIQRDVEAFFEHKDGSPADYFNTTSNFANLYQTALWVIHVLIGDSLLVYRMYVVYNRRLIIVALPIALLIATAVSGSMVAYEFSRVITDPNLFTRNVTPWTTSIVAVTLTQNLLSTMAIASRLWWAGRSVGKWFGGRHWPAITVFLESGLPYTLTLLILTILDTREQALYVFAYYSLVPISGISFTGLIIRVGLRSRQEGINSRTPKPTYAPKRHVVHRVSGPMGYTTSDPGPAGGQDFGMSTMTKSSGTFNSEFDAIPIPDIEKAVLPPQRSFQ